MAERLKDIFFTQSSINLNDISKDHPNVVLDICERWYGQSKETDKIAKHAPENIHLETCRPANTMQGNITYPSS